MRRVSLLLPILLPLVVASLPSARAEESEPIEAGRISRRFPGRGTPYAIYAPKRWRKRNPVPLVVHVVFEKMIPYSRLHNCGLPPEADRAAARGFVALHAAVLLEAHNKENVSSNPSVDRDRYAQLLERDAAHVAAVIEHMAAEVPLRRDAVFIRGMRYAGEAALGLATRRPDLFAGAMGYHVRFSTIGWKDDDFVLPWAALAPDVEKARGLPVFLTHEPSADGAAATARMAHQVMRLKALLEGLGFGHVVGVPRKGGEGAGHFLTPEGWAWLEERAAEQAVRTRTTSTRDELLADGRRHLEGGRLSPALRAYRKARALEVEHSLDESSADLYRRLEAEGRGMLSRADGLEPTKRRSAYRKVARLFQDTPLAEEVDALLEGMR